MQNILKNISYIKLNRILKPVNTINKSTAHLGSSLNKKYNTKSILKLKENEALKYSDPTQLHNSAQQQLNNTTFEKEIKFRIDQAKRSFLIKINSPSQYLKSTLNSLFYDLKMMNIQVESAHLFGDEFNKFILIEFKRLESVSQLNQHCEIFDFKYPVTTRIIFYKKKTKNSYQVQFNITDHTGVNLTDYDCKSFEKATNINEQIKIFYESNRIDDFNLRLRYFLSSLIEDCINGLFRDSSCIPFGSSLNTFGAKSADLDLSCSLHGHRSLKKNSKFFMGGDFVFMFNSNLKNDSSRIRSVFGLFEIFSAIMPRFKFENAIPHARVPILKFKADIGYLYSCDLSLTQIEIAYLMTKLFWTYSKLDERVAPTVFLIRHWAANTGVKSQTSPSTLFSSFHLTCLVFYYLLNLKDPLIVPLDDLITNNDQYLKLKNYDTDNPELEEILRNLKMEDNLLKYKNNLKNNMKIIDLVQGFFKFYSNYDFKNKVIHLNKKSSNLNTNGRCFIQHPFAPLTNACKNVSVKNLDSFRNKCRMTNDIIQESKENLNLKEFISQFKSISKINEETSIFDDMNM